MNNMKKIIRILFLTIVCCFVLYSIVFLIVFHTEAAKYPMQCALGATSLIVVGSASVAIFLYWLFHD